MKFDSPEWSAFYRVLDAARDLGHESRVDAICVLFEDDASGEKIKAEFKLLIREETLKHAERAADAA